MSHIKIPILSNMTDKELLELREEYLGKINNPDEYFDKFNLTNEIDILSTEIDKRIKEFKTKYENLPEEDIEKLRNEANKDWKVNYIQLTALKFSPGFF